MTVPQRNRPTPRVHDTYLQLLAALALVGVVTFHTFEWWWLFLAFPFMGILFALAGRRTASALDQAESPRAFYAVGIPSLLLPLWVFGTAAVPLMLALDRTAIEPAGAVRASWSGLWLWAFPLSQPPGFSTSFEWVQPVWFVTTCLWLLLLSPALLWLFQRWPLRTVAAPAGLMALLASGFLVLDPGPVSNAVYDGAVFGGCWLIGFAHHEGALQRLPLNQVLPAAAALMGAGLWHALDQRIHHVGLDWEVPPLAVMLYSVGAVLMLLRFESRSDRLARTPWLTAVLELLHSRATTIYLWSGFAVAVVSLVLRDGPLARYGTAGPGGDLLTYGVVWLLLLAVLPVLGWCEDVAAAGTRSLRWNRVRSGLLSVLAADRTSVAPPAGRRPHGGDAPARTRRAEPDPLPDGVLFRLAAPEHAAVPVENARPHGDEQRERHASEVLG
jgi:peptidoglycan/LPS O-acetylase OafA/YrhL